MKQLISLFGGELMARKSKESNSKANLPFPKRLRELLDSPGQTQAKLASAINVNQQTVSLWKDGKTAPDIYSLERISNYYNVSTDYLLGKTDFKSSYIEDIAINNKLGLSDPAFLKLYVLNRCGFSEELSALILNAKLNDALVTLKEIRYQVSKYSLALKAIADIININEGVTSQDIMRMINNHKKECVGKNNSEFAQTLYVSEHIDFLRLKLINTMRSIVDDITELQDDEDEYIIKKLIGFLDKTNPASYDQKVNTIKNYNAGKNYVFLK
jgi:transcriptional regulator with XRE-family HTH domain